MVTWDVESSIRDVDEVSSSFTWCIDDVLAECSGVHSERKRVTAWSNNCQLQLGFTCLVSDYYTHIYSIYLVTCVAATVAFVVRRPMKVSNHASYHH